MKSIISPFLMTLGIGIAMLLAQLPWRLQMWLGQRLGGLLFRLMKTRREVARKNIDLCFPTLPADARLTLLHDHFSAVGMGLFEFIRAWWGRVGKTAPLLSLEGESVLTELAEDNTPVLLISGHFTCFEICGRLLAERYPLSAMYRAQNNLQLDRAILRGRRHYTLNMFTRDQLRPAFKFLKAGGRLWYAPDQDMIDKETVFVPFFGVAASTITATAQMARVSGAKVVPFGLKRSEGGYHIKLGQPLANFPSGDAESDATTVNEMLEAMVRECPEQYLWIHRRFKTRPPGEPLLY